jgi:hypothetical protein
LSFEYNGGYGRRVKSSDFWDLYNSAHLTYGYSKAITPRWTYGLNMNAGLMDFDSYFLSPTATTAVSSPTVGQPGGIPNLVNNGPAPNSPAQSALYGGRVFNTVVSNNLTFAKSPRLTYHMGISLTRSQYVGRGGNATSSGNSSVNSSRGLLGQGSYGDASFGLAYSLTPRTNIGASVNLSRGISSIADYYYTNAQFHVAHSMTQWWRVQASAGAGFNGTSSRAFPTFGAPRPVGGASTTVSGFSQSVTLGVAATVDDIYAIGATRTLTGSASWGLHPAGSHWSFFAGTSDYITRSGGNGSLSAWNASAGTRRVLTDHLFWSVSANYANFRGLLLNNIAAASGSSFASAFNNQSYRGVQMSLTWTPVGLKW